MREDYLEYLRSDHWKDLRKSAIGQWGDRCSNCRVPEVDVHHLRYGMLYDVTVNDLMPLCRRCHDAVHESPKLRALLVSNESSDKKRSLVLGFLAGRDEALSIKVKWQSRAQIEAERREIHKKLSEQTKKKGPDRRTRFLVPGKPVNLSRKLIEACQSPRGGYTAETIRALGLSFPLPAKWPKLLAGKTISYTAYMAAREGRFSKVRNTPT